MIKMMVTVVFVYSVCWLPYNVLLIVSSKISETVMSYLYFPLHGLAVSHACYNPIIYCYMNARFREGLNQVLRSIPCLRRCAKPPSGHSGFPHTGIEGTDSTILQRNNTCTTYISMKRNTCNRTSTRSSQLPVRSVSLMRTDAQDGRRNRFNSTVIDEQI